MSIKMAVAIAVGATVLAGALLQAASSADWGSSTYGDQIEKIQVDRIEAKNSHAFGIRT